MQKHISELRLASRSREMDMGGREGQDHTADISETTDSTLLTEKSV